MELAARIAAATATAQNTQNACAAIQPFYWEVGDQQGKLGAGSQPWNNGQPTYTGTSMMSIASAAKWLYGATVVQQRQGRLTESDVQFLTF